MDKKKVKELIEKIQKRIKNVYGLEYEDTINLRESCELLKELKQEIQKSDWISVKDRQPPKNVVVRVCNKQNPDDVVLAYRTNQETMKIVYPSNVALYSITHWKPIEKLEE